MRPDRKLQRGFTLVEMIVVIAIMGILGGVIAAFIGVPVQGYLDSARRAEMSDIADTAGQRLARDIRIAVPNSARLPTPAGSTYIEFLPTKAGGRYRALADPGGVVPVCGGTVAQDILDFTAADNCFEILGPPITFAAGDQIVLGSTQSNGLSPYDSSVTGVLRAFNGTPGSQPTGFITAVQFPALAALPSQHFSVVPGNQQAVTYACENVGTDTKGDGAGTLKRYWKYGFTPAQATPPEMAASAVLGVASASTLADKISSCNIVYDAAKQLISITLVISRNNESISLHQEIHVSNTP